MVHLIANSTGVVLLYFFADPNRAGADTSGAVRLTRVILPFGSGGVKLAFANIVVGNIEFAVFFHRIIIAT